MIRRQNEQRVICPRLVLRMLQRHDGACTDSKTLTSTRSNAVAPLQMRRQSTGMMHILAATKSEGAFADGEKAFMQGGASVRREPFFLLSFQPEGLPDVPEGALIRLASEVYGLVSRMSGWRSKVVNEWLQEGFEIIERA